MKIDNESGSEKFSLTHETKDVPERIADQSNCSSDHMENRCKKVDESNNLGENEEEETWKELEKDTSFIKCFNFVMNVSKKLSNPEKFIQFLRHLSNYSFGYINNVELGMVVVKMIGEHMDLVEDFVDVLRELDGVDVKPKKKKNKRKHAQFQEAELKLIPPCQERPNKRRCGEREYQELNDDDLRNETRVCVTKCQEGSKDDKGRYSNPSIQTNGKSNLQCLKQQRLRFEVADEIDKVDVLTCWLSGAREFGEKSLEGRYDETCGSIKKNLFKRCVDMMYGDHGQEVLDLFEENPKGVLPTVLTRLRQKEEELEEFRNRMVPIWMRKRAGLC